MPDLRRIGGSQFDLYTGVLTVADIQSQIIDYLNKYDHLGYAEYTKFINEGGGFQTCQLNDGSSWVLRKGINDQCYVHVHPGRYSPNSVRIRSGTLKTLIVSLATFKTCSPDLKEINQIRGALLELPPLRQIDTGYGIGKLFKIFNDLDIKFSE